MVLVLQEVCLLFLTTSFHAKGRYDMLVSYTLHPLYQSLSPLVVDSQEWYLAVFLFPSLMIEQISILDCVCVVFIFLPSRKPYLRPPFLFLLFPFLFLHFPSLVLFLDQSAPSTSGFKESVDIFATQIDQVLQTALVFQNAIAFFWNLKCLACVCACTVFSSMCVAISLFDITFDKMLRFDQALSICYFVRLVYFGMVLN